MKRLLMMGAISFTTLTFAQTPAYVPTDDLVGWWPFNGNVNDESGNGNNGTVNGATLTTNTIGTADAAYNFDGIDDNISFADNADLNFSNTEAFTVQAWVKSDLFGSPGMIVSKIAHASPYTGYEVFTNTTGAIGVYLINDFDQGNYILTQSDTEPLSDSQWHHLLVSYDGSSQASGINIYLDGVSISHTASTDNLTGSMTNTIPVNVGSRNQQCCFEAGDIDNIGIWRRALTACEIEELYNEQLTIDNNITQVGPTLTADQTGATYQWLDCDDNNSLINGETNQSYTPIITGNYAVEISLSGCVDTSNCFIVDFTGIENFTLPNKEVVKVLDLMGRETIPQKNKVLIYLYSDGTSEKIFELE